MHLALYTAEEDQPKTFIDRLQGSMFMVNNYNYIFIHRVCYQHFLTPMYSFDCYIIDGTSQLILHNIKETVNLPLSVMREYVIVVF